MPPGLKDPYREAFETDNLTVAVVTQTQTHRHHLQEWTLRELVKRKAPGTAVAPRGPSRARMGR